MISIPIVRNGTEEIIGLCTTTENANSLDVEFIDGANVTRKEFFKMFGCSCYIADIGAAIKGRKGLDNFIVKRAKINSFRWEPV